MVTRLVTASLAAVCLLAAVHGPAAAAATGGVDDRIRAAAEQVLAAGYPDAYPRLAVRVVRTGGTIDAEAALRLAFPDEGTTPRAHTQVSVLAQGTDGAWGKVGWALLYVAHFDSVAVVENPRSKDEEVAPSDVRFVWMETTTNRSGLLRHHDFRARAASGALFAKRILRAGRALRQTDLRPAYAAILGDAVTLRYRRGQIVLVLTCTARESGFAGDTIRLYAEQTDTLYRARLRGDGTAQWVDTL